MRVESLPGGPRVGDDAERPIAPARGAQPTKLPGESRPSSDDRARDAQLDELEASRAEDRYIARRFAEERPAVGVEYECSGCGADMYGLPNAEEFCPRCERDG